MDGAASAPGTLEADATPSTRRLEVESVAEGLLELLESRGVRCFFGGGAGTDFPPVIEAFARRQALGRAGGLRPITVAHEITAVAMAHGYAMVTGEPQAVMVHTLPGTANALGGVINAARARVPMLLLAGRTAITERGLPDSRSLSIHWAQESFDQAGLLREFVKWDYELRCGDQLETVVDRALAIACSPPAGPVYLTLPVDVIGAPMPPLTIGASPRLRPSRPSQPTPATLREAAETLARATNPLAITSSLGRDPAAPGALVRLADRLGLPVVETWPTHLNFPRDHPMHQGFDAGALVGDADIVLAVESDTPWFPARAEPPRGAVVVQVDDDPLYATYPIRGFASDIGLAGHAGSTLRALAAELERIPLDEPAIAARRRRWAAAHERRREAWRTAGEAVRDATPLDYAWISKCLGDVLDPEDIVVTEIVLDPRAGVLHAPRHVLQPRPLGGARLGGGRRARGQDRAPPTAPWSARWATAATSSGCRRRPTTPPVPATCRCCSWSTTTRAGNARGRPPSSTPRTAGRAATRRCRCATWRLLPPTTRSARRTAGTANGSTTPPSCPPPWRGPSTWSGASGVRRCST